MKRVLISRIWSQAFLEKRPSTSLGLFRLAVALTVGAHMIPSFFHMEDNYLSTAFKTKNFSFFPVWILRLLEHSPEAVVWSGAALFCLALGMFTLGLFSQMSCIVMTLCCYYFYALNNYHIGTLSFDILLVTLCLMCLTGYHGDFLSLDSLRRGDIRTYKRQRPFFIQRLLQLQIAWTFWYTALSKVTTGGNWITDNPYYYLMHYPSIGVVRDFPLRAWLGQHPALCHQLGLTCLAFESLVPLVWFIPKTRPVGIALGIAFQLMLWLTLQVPTIFLFLFPPLMLLFIRPEALVEWIESRHMLSSKHGRAMLFYDGQCGFCLASVRRLRVVDLFGWVDPLDCHKQPDLSKMHPSLTPERCHSEMVLLEPDGRVSGGFDAFTRLCLHLPLLMWLIPLVCFPGVDWIGARVYRWVAEHRYLLHRNAMCATNHCAVRTNGNGSSKI